MRRENLGGDEGGEAVIEIYCIKKFIFNLKKFFFQILHT